MSAFDYVMTLAAVVIGLALTHLMQGVGRILEDPRGAKIWWVHLLWVAHTGLLCAERQSGRSSSMRSCSAMLS